MLPFLKSSLTMTISFLPSWDTKCFRRASAFSLIWIAAPWAMQSQIMSGDNSNGWWQQNAIFTFGISCLVHIGGELTKSWLMYQQHNLLPFSRTYWLLFLSCPVALLLSNSLLQLPLLVAIIATPLPSLSSPDFPRTCCYGPHYSQWIERKVQHRMLHSWWQWYNWKARQDKRDVHCGPNLRTNFCRHRNFNEGMRHKVARLCSRDDHAVDLKDLDVPTEIDVRNTTCPPMTIWQMQRGLVLIRNDYKSFLCGLMCHCNDLNIGPQFVSNIFESFLNLQVIS